MHCDSLSSSIPSGNISDSACCASSAAAASFFELQHERSRCTRSSSSNLLSSNIKDIGDIATSRHRQLVALSNLICDIRVCNICDICDASFISDGDYDIQLRRQKAQLQRLAAVSAEQQQLQQQSSQLLSIQQQRSFNFNFNFMRLPASTAAATRAGMPESTTGTTARA